MRKYSRTVQLHARKENDEHEATLATVPSLEYPPAATTTEELDNLANHPQLVS